MTSNSRYIDYPYGMLMPNRHGSSNEGYRCGFNGMEADDEIKGNGNSYTTEFRQYDPRIGRWLSLDPLMAKYPSMSPYVAFNNNPIFYIDPYGLEGTNPDGGPPLDINPNEGSEMYDGNQQRYTTPIGKTPNQDELSNYQYDTDKMKWSVGNDFRLKADPKFRSEMNSIGFFGVRLQNELMQLYGLDKSRLNSDITFGYGENEGEFPTFKLNMIYVSLDGTRTPVGISFGTNNRVDNEDGTSSGLYKMGLMDLDMILSSDNQNCYANILGVPGNIDSEKDFIKAVQGNGYKPVFGSAPKAGDIFVVYGKHAMIVLGNNDKGETIYRSGNRGAYPVVFGTLNEINEQQFGDGLLMPGDESFYMRKQ